ncbi:MAG: cell division FtsA domain-containing protein [Bacillota bacterium]|nr:cell division FtsA domain-containing protein [Bacillota bacterium]
MSKRSIVLDPNRLIFAMDIGTRSIVGLVCYPENNKIKVLESEIAYHPRRDMFDGQIHNIEGVVNTARNVKEALEKKLGVSLKSVAIAAAGRALKTCRSLAEREIEPGRKTKKEEISSLELEAVEKAQEILVIEDEIDSADAYYCVGFTTAAYYLDDYPISSLIGQKGRKMGIEVLATFLPQVVVDSLLTVVEELGLSVSNLTLEPIAALNVTIPLEYRSLNLALVDVGAGTSDIAITHKGSVVGYAMVPLAGDEVTEQIAETFLLDFNTAENVKLMLSQKKGNISFKDIIGNSHTIREEEILKVIEPAVEKIASEIASVIKEYNKGPTRAVFCIGGGSYTPFLRKKLAEQLQLSPEMVAIRGREFISQVIYTGKKLNGPEFITPFGIAVSALQKEYFGFSYLTVNGKVVRLLDTENLKVGNALITAGFNSKKLLGHRGAGLKFILNGKEKIFPGLPGENARILVNGKEASLETIIKNNDKLEVIEALEGLSPLVKVKELLPSQGCSIYFNGELTHVSFRIFINGEEADSEMIVQEGDRVELGNLGTLQDFFNMSELDPGDIIFQVNERTCPLTYELQPEDRITVSLIKKADRQGDLAQKKMLSDKSLKSINNMSVVNVTVNDKTLNLRQTKDLKFVDIFNYINFDRSRPQGQLIMTHNDQPASLTAKLNNNDLIQIYWKK